jgi:hypothetical protein
MRATTIFLILAAGNLSAADRMNISVCNLGALPQFAITSAIAEVSAVFRAAKVEIAWKSCDDLPGTVPSAVRWFVLRLRWATALWTAVTSTSTSLDVMGRAFVADTREGGMADAYFEAIQDLAIQFRIDSGALLGYVIVHELGHLLLGPGHVANGVSVMRGRWTPDELRALRQRWLRFTKEQQARIHQELQTNAGGN